MPGEANLWPALTGGETLHLLGGLHGGVDEAYRDELSSGSARRHEDTGVLEGNRQKVVLVAALMTRPDLLLLDEPRAGSTP